ncbi:cytochrome c, 20 heme-binding sites [Geotalea daltonii FRC-32]|uniref:Cytochrome c, 20 heme-binding sites n=1 Tax=Geotalea daltonii (strain DSM 22248 / JCM 15807 / FRC-32) TaxID=316067 RepID=B9M1H2_GEODF|nr:CxxxxCH/CxxCH domain-containing protein [Geotalea daltonii]ACM21054.1 cytochrome c, 20 heme-binding sites [Geotalea daltonii FRC-32]
MGKRIIKRIHGMGVASKLGLVMVLTVLVSVFMYQGLFKPNGISATPTISNAWTNVYSTAASTAAVDVTSSSFSVNTGNTNRLLLVAVQFETSAATTLVSPPTISYGGVNLTQIQNTFAFSGRSHAYMGYLRSSQIPAGLNAVRVQASTGNSNTFQGVQIAVASYFDIDQTNPINDSSQSATASASVTFGSQVDYVANGITVFCATNGGSPATLTSPTGFTGQSGATSTASGSSGFVASSAVHAAPGSYAGTTSVSFGGTTSTRSALVVASLRPATVLSNNADLGSMTISAGELTPAFSSTVTSYTAAVTNGTSSITVTPTLADANAEVTVNGVEVASGTASSPISLAVGDNTISIRVTAQDEVTTKTYTIVVNRAATGGGGSNVTYHTRGLTSIDLIAHGATNVVAEGDSLNGGISYNFTVATNQYRAITSTTAPSGTYRNRLRYGADWSGTTEVLRSYTSKYSSAMTIGANATTRMCVYNRGTVNNCTGYAEIYEYNDNSGIVGARKGITPVSATFSGSTAVNIDLTFNNAAFPVSSGNRVVVYYYLTANTSDPCILYGAAYNASTPAGTTYFTLTESAGGGSSTNANLSNLALSSGTLTPAFASSTTSYTASVANTVTSITVTPTEEDTTATTTVNGVPVESGTASGPISLAVESNTVTVVVTAQDGVTKKTYTVVVTRAPSTNANLSNLTLSTGTLTPAFASGTISYTASVTNSTTSLTVTPTAQDTTATIKVNGITVASGVASAAIPLAVGSNTINTVVTAQDGSTTTTYTVVVTRAPSTNANLSSLTLSNGTLIPAFASGTTYYTASVTNGTTSVTVTPTVQDSTATVTINGVSVASGTPSGAIPLSVGSNTINTVVTAQDGSTTKTYTVVVTRAPSTNANLSNLALSAGTLTPAFASGTTSYAASVSNATSTITVTPTVQDATATITVNGVAVTSGTASVPFALVVGANTLNTVVTAQDGATTKIYTVMVTRAASTNANLNNFALSSGTLSPAFASGTTSYTASVSNATSTITVTPTAQDSTATIKVNGVAVTSGTASVPFALVVGANTLNTVVTAQDGTTTKTYTVVVTRAPSTNTNLSNLVLSAGTLSPSFASGTTSYTASVTNATSSITVTPTVQDTTATIKVNGATVASGSASGAITLTVGSNTIDTQVTAQDGTTIKTYTVVVTRAAPVINSTTASALTFSAVTRSSITVTAPYSGDADNDNSCVIRWGTSSGSYPNVATATKTGSAYVATISSGLQPLTPYFFQATFTDSDGVSGSPVSGTQSTAANGATSPLMHNGANLGTKYNGGNWGVDYTCATCHSRVPTSNIKKVMTLISGRTVSFLQMTGATNSFGNDGRPRLGKSTNVCEVCHTQTIFHRYSSNPGVDPLPGGYAHKNRLDCTTCHPHNKGFAGSGCDGCHGNPPTTANIDNSNNTGMVWSPEPTGATNPVGPGGHSVHESRGIKCDACHNGNTMSDVSYTIQMGFNINGTNWTGFPGSAAFGTFSARTPTNNKYSFVNSNPGTMVRQSPSGRNSCNVYCHGNWAGANGNLTASWEGGSAQAQCGACHRATAGNPPTNGSHLAHAGASPNLRLGCDKCHGTHTNNTHANGTVTWDLTSISTSARYNGALSGSTNAIAPSSSYQTCSNLYCHSTVQPNGGTGNPASYFTPKWGDSATVSGCGACHTDMQASGTGNHLKHTAKYSCTICHNAAGDNSTKHADNYIDVAFSGAGTGTSYTQARTLAGSDGYGTCSTISCHGSGASSTAWGNTLNCGGCHLIANLKGAHGKHINTAALPTLYNYTANRSTTIGYNFGCSNCHPLDVLTKHVDGYIDVTLNATNTGNGGSVGYLRSRNSATADGLAPSKGASGIYGTSGASVRCSASYCHSNAYAGNQKFIDSPDWYGSYTGTDKCAMCHGNSPNANDPTNQPGSPAHYSKNFLGFANISSGHVIGIHAKNIFTGRFGLAAVGNTAVGSHGNASTSSTINCNMCHYSTVTTYANDKNKACAPCHSSTPKNPAELIADKTFHINGKVDVAFAPIRVKSKAQIRGADYNSSLWSRQVGYKVSGAYDVAFKTFTTATQWNETTKTCSNIACHNGASVKWGDTGGVTNCASCHF